MLRCNQCRRSDPDATSDDIACQYCGAGNYPYRRYGLVASDIASDATIGDMLRANVARSDAKARGERRAIGEIAREILATWRKPYFGAVPYLRAMLYLDNIDDSYGYDSAREIVVRFLGNAATWRGEDARRIKKELRAMLR